MKKRRKKVDSATCCDSTCGVGGAARQDPGDGLGEDDADDRDDRHDGQGEAEDPRGQAFGLPVVATPEQVDEGGDEHGRERTGGDELEEDVRDRARRLVGVAQVGGAEDGGDHPDLHEADAAGRERGDAHPRRGPRRSIFARHHQRASLRGRARFPAASRHAGAGRPPGRRRPCWGDGTSGGGWALSTVLERDLASPLVLRAMHAALLVAETALLEERRPLTRDEVLAVAARPLDELPDLVALAHRVRLAYCGAEVELESLINAKSGACPEDCAFCSQSARYSTDVDVYPLLQLDEVLEAARATRAAGATQFCIVVAVRGPSERMLTRVIEAVDAVHARDRPRGRVLARSAHPGAGGTPRRGGREALQPQPRGAARAVPVDRDHPHLRRPRRDRPSRHRRRHGAVLRRHPRHGRDARAARRLRVRARRARTVRGADQLPAPHRHAARRRAPHHARARRCRRSRCSVSCCRARGSASPVVASTCSASCRRWACSRARTR